ncbi:hypothetical protein Milano_074 [Agrobacterium phage Milano]|nr:hypothetical protein Milano_074 [Agrobacterium phage Milano]
MQMTKKAQKAAEVLENRKAAFVKKVAGLLGHVFSRQPLAGVVAAFEAGVSAEDFSTSVASREPVGLCLHPMKIDACDAMEAKVRDATEKLLSKLAEHDGDIFKAFPYNENWRTRTESDKGDERLHNHVRRLTTDTEELIEVREYHRRNFKRVPNPESIERFVQENRDIAAMNYDMFICKMVQKVGEGVVSATIEGSHIWGNSILTVVKESGKVERWHTQTIWNYSKYGLPFNQWPSRLKK